MILGKVEVGTLNKGDKIMLMPTGVTCKVDSITSDETPIKQVRAVSSAAPSAQTLAAKSANSCGSH